MSTLHVQRNLQFRSDLDTGVTDKTAWFKEMGAQLAQRGLKIQVGNLTVSNSDEAVALYDKFKADPSGFEAAVNLPQTTEVDSYFSDLTELFDDCVKPTSDVRDMMIDGSPAS